MPTHSHMRVTSGAVSDATGCRVEVVAEAPDQIIVYLKSPKYQVQFALTGGQLATFLTETHAALDQAGIDGAARAALQAKYVAVADPLGLVS